MSGHVEKSRTGSGLENRSHGRTRSQNPGGFYSSNIGQSQVGIPEENLQLVPCRWSHTGWKYVQTNPDKANFFSNPNRVNSFGFSSGKKQVNSQSRRMGASQNAKSGGFTPQDSEFQTSYTRFFNNSNINEMKGWKQKFNNADFGAQKNMKEMPSNDQLIQWAGGLHQRCDFNKRKDNLGNWTEVLFHH